MTPFRISQNGVSLRFGDADTPVPEGSISAIPPAIVVAVSPVDPRIRVQLRTRINSERDRVISLKQSRRTRDEQFFEGSFQDLRGGDRVEYSIHVELERSSGSLGFDTAEVSGGLRQFELIGGTPRRTNTLSIDKRASPPSPITLATRVPARTAPVVSNRPSESVNVSSNGGDQHTIEGKIFLEYGLPAQGIILRVYNRGFGGTETKLGEVKTDDKGSYNLAFSTHGKGANLEVRAVDALGKEIPLSATKFGAAEHEVLNLVAPAGLQPQASEYQRLAADLAPHVGGMKNLADARENAQQQDLTVLNRNTGWDARLIALATTAARLSADPDIDLSQEALYGLFRAGLPSEKFILAQVDPEVVGQALEQLSKVGIVNLQPAQILAIKNDFKTFGDKVRLKVPAPGSQTTYGELLDAAGIGNAKDKFMQVFVNHHGDGVEIWQRARDANIDEASIRKLQWQGKLAFLAGNSGGVTKYLMEQLQGDPLNPGGTRQLKSPAKLIKQDLYEAEQWKTEMRALAANDDDLQALIPTAYQGGTVEARLDAYAEDMARKIRLSYPTQVVGRMIEKDTIKLDAAKGATVKLLDEAVAQGFKLGQTPVESFMRTREIAPAGMSQADLATGKEELKKLQRVYQITPSNAAMPVLIELGLTSAYDLTALREDEFYALFSEKYLELYKKPPTEAEKRLIWRKAQQVSSMTYNLFAVAKKLDTDPAIPAISGTPEQRAAAKGELKGALKDYPTMESLFGSMDFCECEHCRSVLSPAAYFVDLLQFLEGEPQAWSNFLADWNKRNSQNYNAKYMAPYDTLIQRRPDLPHIPLTCENTNVALPYIDVVNEILEYYVANDKLTEEAARDTGDATSAELLAEPQYVVTKAYDTLRQDKYPLTLPFDLWLETVRQFCDYTETPLARVLEAFRRADDLFATGQDYDRASIFIESLGLSPAERKIFADPSPLAKWWELYGFASQEEATNEAVDLNTGQRIDLNSAKALSRRLGVTYKELVEIVKTRFVNPALAELGILYKLPASIAEMRFFLDAANQAFYIANKDLLEKELDSAQQARLVALSKDDWQRLADMGAFSDRVSAYAKEFTLQEADVLTELAEVPLDKILVLADPDAGCNFDETILRYADTHPADAPAFLRLNLFVRLWRKLGWTMEEMDRALQVFVPVNTPFELAQSAGVDLNANFTRKPLETALIYLAHLKALDGKVRVDKPSRINLLTLWSNIPTTGKKSLYAQLFLTRSMLKADPIFDHPQGDYLAPPWVAAQGQGKPPDFVRIKGHLPAIQSALGITADEVAEILEDVQLSFDTAELTLANLSLLYRYRLLAKALKISIQEVITLKALSGKNPFLPLEAEPLTDLSKDHPFTETLRFVEIAEEVRQSGFKISDLDFLLRWRFDPTGPYRQDRSATFVLLKTLADGVRGIRTEHAVPTDPSALTEEFLQQKLGLLLVPTTVQRLLRMLRGEETLDDATRSFFDNQLKKQQVRLAGEAGFLEENDYPDLFTAFKPLKKLKEIVPDDTIEEIEAKSAENEIITAENESILIENRAELQRRRRKTAEVFLYVLQNRLIRQLIVQTLATETGADPALVECLVTDSRLLQITLPASSSQPLLNAFTATGELGIDADFYTSPTGADPRQPTAPRVASADTVLKDTKDGAGNTLPPANSARFAGYLVVPATGVYRFYLVLDKQAAESHLIFPHLAQPTFLKGTAATDAAQLGGGAEEYLELKAGIPYRFELELDNLNAGDARLLVQGELSPRGSLTQLGLYSAVALETAEKAYKLLGSALLLLQILGLTEREARYILTHADQWGDVELSNLPTTQIGDTPAERASVVRHFEQFLRLAAYSRLKRDIAGGTDDLITVFEANGTTEPNKLTEKVYPLIAQLTRRNPAVVQEVAEVLFVAPTFASDEPVQRLWEALQLIERFGATAIEIQGWTKIVSDAATDEQRFFIARGLKEAIKARFDPEAWQRVVQPIFDQLRRRQRDALVAHIMHQEGFARLEQLYEYFLVDPGMEPVVQTSRIRLASASVQLFIQRCLLNLERDVHPSAILNADQWDWMKRYRVWEANRKIFLFPENWLEPEFRDDKSHLFTELESALLQDDVSADTVEDAFLNYLKKLEELARLDIVAMHLETRPDFGKNTLHVFGRTFSQPHKYFYRGYANSMWTPWEPVTAEIEGDHLAPVVWRNRLYLFWVTFTETAAPAGSRGVLDTNTPTPIDITKIEIPKLQRQVEVQLHWSEYVQGIWSTKESGGYAPPEDLKIRVDNVPADFRAQDVFVHVAMKADPTPELETVENMAQAGVYIHLGKPIYRSFHLVSRNAAPEPGQYETGPAMRFIVDTTKHRATRYVGNSNLTVTFSQRISTEPGKTRPEPATVLKTTGQFTLLPCDNTIGLGVSKEAYEGAQNPAEVQAALEASVAEIEALMKPLFFQDAAHTLFIEPDVTERTVEEWQEWVTHTPVPGSGQPAWVEDPRWWERYVKPAFPKIPLPDSIGPVIRPDPASIIQDGRRLDWLINPDTGLIYEGQVIGPQGKVPVEIIPTNKLTDMVSKGASVVNVTVGSQVAPGTVAVLTDTWQGGRMGLTNFEAGINFVGGGGLNAALQKNVENLAMSGMAGQQGLAGARG